ncbi:MAG: copper resistance protein CopC [Anaerolineae bacterium]|nr:copper resistance protein CopC [Anaerolineae bacterium]
MTIFNGKNSINKVLTSAKSWFIALLLAWGTALVPASAFAHAGLVRSDPADNAVLTEPPAEIRLWFSEAISPDFSGAQILDINGRPVQGVSLRVNPAENLLILTPPALAEGLYSVRWKVLSEADGHFTQGLLVFGLGEGVDLSQAAAAETEAGPPPWEVWLRWLNFSALLALAGSVGVAFLVLGSGRALPAGEELNLYSLRRAAQGRVLALATGWSSLAWLAGFGLLLWQILLLANSLAEEASLAGVGWQLVSGTRWGWFWLARQGVLLLLSGVLFRLHRSAGAQKSSAMLLRSHLPPRRASLGRVHGGAPLGYIAALLLLALLTIQALTGHAAALTAYTALAVLVDTLHLLAASLWVGGLLALLAGLLPLLRRDRADFAALARASVGPFSRSAALSVGLLVATGLYSTGHQVASLDALLGTLYGQTLLAKLGLLLGVGLLGWLNSLAVHPRLAAPLARRLGRPPGWTPLALHHLPRLVLLEAGLGLLVILATGVMTATPPARGPEFEVAAEEIPTALDQTVDDMLITFSAKPNRPGQNMFTVRAVSTRRPPPAEVMRVILRFTFLGQEMGRTSADAVEIEPGLYQIGGNYLSLAGAWQVQVVVRRKGIEDSVAQFNWMVAPPGPARPVFISRRPLESILTPAAGLLGLSLLLVAGWWLGRGRGAQPGLVPAQEPLEDLENPARPEIAATQDPTYRVNTGSL